MVNQTIWKVIYWGGEHICPLGAVLVVIAPLELEFNESVILYDSHLPRFVSITSLVIGVQCVRPYSNVSSYLLPWGVGWMIIKRLPSDFTWFICICKRGYRLYIYRAMPLCPASICPPQAGHLPHRKGHLFMKRNPTQNSEKLKSFWCWAAGQVLGSTTWCAE